MMHVDEDFFVPAGDQAVQVRIIDSTSRIDNLELGFLVKPPIDGCKYMPTMPSWSFLIEHPSGKKALFDLGVPKSWRSFPPTAVGHIDGLGWEVKVEKDVIDILSENGVRPEEISSIIWRWKPPFLFMSCYNMRLMLKAISIGIIPEIPPGFRRPQNWLLARGSKRPSCLPTLKVKALPFGNVTSR
jgi:hypothetical protein